MPFFLLKLLGIGRWLKGAFLALLSWVRRYPLQAALIVAVCASLWLWRGRQAARVEAARWEQAFAEQKAGYEKAQADAKAKQLAADKANLASQTALAAQVEQAHAANDTIRKNAVDAYARANPVRVCRQAPGSAPGGSGPADVPGDPGQPSDPTEIPGMVALTRSDLDDLTREAVQGAERFNYLDALIKEGLAVKASELPRPDMPVDR